MTPFPATFNSVTSQEGRLCGPVLPLGTSKRLVPCGESGAARGSGNICWMSGGDIYTSDLPIQVEDQGRRTT